MFLGKFARTLKIIKQNFEFIAISNNNFIFIFQEF